MADSQDDCGQTQESFEELFGLYTQTASSHSPYSLSQLENFSDSGSRATTTNSEATTALRLGLDESLSVCPSGKKSHIKVKHTCDDPTHSAMYFGRFL